MGPKGLLALGTAVIAVGYVLRIIDSQYPWAIMVGAATITAGTALTFSTLPALIMAASPPARPPPPTAATSWPARSARP